MLTNPASLMVNFKSVFSLEPKVTNNNRQLMATLHRHCPHRHIQTCIHIYVHLVQLIIGVVFLTLTGDVSYYITIYYYIKGAVLNYIIIMHDKNIYLYTLVYIHTIIMNTTVIVIN